MPTCEYGFVVPRAVQVEPRAERATARGRRPRPAPARSAGRALPSQVSDVWRTSMFRSAGSSDIRNGTSSWPRFCLVVVPIGEPRSRGRAPRRPDTRRWSFSSSTPGVPSGFLPGGPEPAVPELDVMRLVGGRARGLSHAPSVPSLLGEMTSRNGRLDRRLGCRRTAAERRPGDVAVGQGSMTRPPIPKNGRAPTSSRRSRARARALRIARQRPAHRDARLRLERCAGAAKLTGLEREAGGRCEVSGSAMRRLAFAIIGPATSRCATRPPGRKINGASPSEPVVGLSPGSASGWTTSVEPPHRGQDPSARKLDRLVGGDREDEPARPGRAHFDRRDGPHALAVGHLRLHRRGLERALVVHLRGRRLVDRRLAEVLVREADDEPCLSPL